MFSCLAKKEEDEDPRKRESSTGFDFFVSSAMLLIPAAKAWITGKRATFGYFWGLWSKSNSRRKVRNLQN